MAKTTLTISSKNYSSWSLRGWLLAKFARLDFEEIVTAPDDASARAEILLRYPGVRLALEGLSGRISADDMRAMNYAADVEHKDVVQIVREFLQGK